MGRQTRRTKIINLLNQILITSECKSCNVCLRLDFPNNRIFPVSPNHWNQDQEQRDSKHPKYRGSLSGKRMDSIYPIHPSRIKPQITKQNKRKKRKRWSSYFDLLLRGCLKLFGTDLKKISLIIPEFNKSFIVKKIKQIKWKRLSLDNNEYRNLNKHCKSKEKNELKICTNNSPQLLPIDATKEESNRCVTPDPNINKYSKGEIHKLKEERVRPKIIKSPFVFDRLNERKESLIFTTPIQVANNSFSMDELAIKFLNISPGGYNLEDLESESHFALFNKL